MILQILDEESDDEQVDVVKIEGVDGTINVVEHSYDASTVVMSDSNESESELKNQEIYIEERVELKVGEAAANTEVDDEDVEDPLRMESNITKTENVETDENVTARVSSEMHVTSTDDIGEEKMKSAEEIMKILEGENSGDSVDPGMNEWNIEEQKIVEQRTDEQELTIDEHDLNELKIEKKQIIESKSHEEQEDDRMMDIQTDDNEGKVKGNIVPDEENAVNTEKTESPEKINPSTHKSISSGSLIWSLRNINEMDVWWPGTIIDTPDGSRVWYTDSSTYADEPINDTNVIIDIETATISNIRKYFASLKLAVANNKLILGRYLQACLSYWPQRSKTVKALAKKFNIDLMSK